MDCNAATRNVPTWKLRSVLLPMPVYIVADACYTPITGITYGLRRHCFLSWKASERVLEGIVIKGPLILQSLDSKSTSPVVRHRTAWCDRLPEPRGSRPSFAN